MFTIGGGAFLVLLLIAIAFGTSALLIPVLVAGAILMAIAIGRGVAGARVRRPAAPGASSPLERPSDGGAPVSGEGSGSPTGAGRTSA
jgi:hypothetical protein